MIGILMVAALAGATQTGPEEIVAELRAVAQRYVRAQSSDGISIAVVRCGRAAEFALGLDERTKRRPMTPDTPVEIGSVSKAFTGLLLANAVAEGRRRGRRRPTLPARWRVGRIAMAGREAGDAGRAR